MTTDQDLKGLKGWLAVVGVAIVYVTLYSLGVLTHHARTFLSGRWTELITEGSDYYHPTFAAYLYGQTTVYLALSSVFVYLSYLYFAKRYRFPRAFVFAALAWAVCFPLDSWVRLLIVPELIPTEPVFAYDLFVTSIFLMSTGLLIWVPYVLLSKRVKQTFVKGRT